MKNLLLLASLLVATMPALGQGFVNFASAAAGVNAPVTNGYTNQRVSGNAYRAMLYIGPPGTREYSALTTNGVAGSSVIFGTGSLAGYFLGGTRAISGYNPGDFITAQVRVWNTAFSSYEAAPNNEKIISTLINLKLGTGGGPSNLVGLQGMRIMMVNPPTSGVLSNLSVRAGQSITLAPSNSPFCPPQMSFCGGDPPYDYTWSLRGANISFAPALTITNAQPSDAGNYSVRIENISGFLVLSATLTVTGGPPALLLSPAHTNGGFQFVLTGESGSNYVIQSSTDLAASNWVSRLTNTAPFTFVDTNLGVSPQQFYRAVAP